MAKARIGIAMLAAGSSERFGNADKLAQDFRGKALARQALDAVPLELFARAFVIVADGERTWPTEGFEAVLNPDASSGMGTSVALAARLAGEAGLDGLLIALADMPLVPHQHFQALAASCSDSGSIATSAKGGIRMPPAIFGSAHFAQLARLGGDRGARALLAKGFIVECPADWLIDIDTPQALQTYGQARAAAPKPGPTGEN